MTRQERITHATRKLLPSVSKHVLLLASLGLVVGCGDANTVPVAPPFVGGPGGSAGGGGMGIDGGIGGMLGTGGVAGTGTGGTSGGGGVGGTGGPPGPCATSALCHTCPDQFLCGTDDDCTFSGYVCIDSGCDTNGGASIKHCQPSRGGACVDDGDCPNASDYDCMKVGAGGERCVRVSPGCVPANEAYDCVPGFSCEGGVCVDRRVPCEDYLDCPKSHVCSTTPTASFCVRVYRTCHQDEDCAGFGEFCADVDDDGTQECTGELGSSGDACVNASCGTSSAPVCEVGVVGTNSACGDYGLCRTDNDCDAAGGFACVSLWQDGRKECVRGGGSCDQVTDCDPQQVCAAPRNGGPPSCQAGNVP